jgi:ATP-dependent Clp protease protease subunit
MGSLLLTAGAPGQRAILPNARVMVHQPSGGYQGQATDILIHANEIIEIKKRLNQLYVHHTNKSLDVIGMSPTGLCVMFSVTKLFLLSTEKAMERDYFMSAEESVKFGIVDRILTKKEIPPVSGKP